VSWPDLPTVTVDDVPPDAVLLDCREDEEWRAGHIDGAVHVPMNELPEHLGTDPGPLTPDARIVVVCKVGSRSAHVTEWLNRGGFSAVNLEGGMFAWAASGRPMVAEDDAPPYLM
jgi:rhodanese-related sulfurtransferase